MGTLVSFHAHPDDESIGTGGTLARAAAAGHRVVLVFATRGELGEPVPGVLAPGEPLSLRRSAECHASAAVLGAARVAFLAFTDSGMMGAASNDAPYCFWQADVEHAARQLAVVLGEERPDVLTVYDDNGGYGHPDHIQVHRVGRRAAELCGVPVVAQSTTNRDQVVRQLRELAESGLVPAGWEPPTIDVATFGKPAEEITHEVDAVAFAHAKRASMRAHASQLGPDHFLLTMPDPMFAAGMGVESYIVDPPLGPRGAPELFTELFGPLR
jgi:LmbE family N-acetylglucosaminyl deacetylase